MSSQYDTIGSKYSVIKEMITSVMEEENLRTATMAYLSRTEKPRVLDLACGTGFYSKKALDWGADYVVGVDVSSGMVQAAKDLLSKDDNKYHGRIKFEVGNVLDLGKLEGEPPFDIVLGAWLLNYAGSLDELTSMFRTIAANLKDGGVFVGLTPSAVEDVDALARRWTETQAKLPQGFPIQVHYYERLPSGEGWKTEVGNTAGAEKISFKNFHLKKSLYEAGARGAGLQGRMEWPEVEIPERVKAGLINEGWKMYVDGGRHMGIFVVEK